MRFTLSILVLISSTVSIFGQTKKYDSLEVLIQGSLSIYRSQNFYYLEKGDSLIFLPPATQKLVDHEGSRKMLTIYPFRGVLNYHLQSCKKTSSTIKSLRLNDGDLIKLLQKYFDCIKERPIQVESLTKRTAYKVGVNVGYQITSLRVESSSFNPEASKKAVFGLAGEILSLKSNVAVASQLNFTQYEFVDDDLDRSTNFNQIQTKIALKKYFGTELKPFFKGGISFNYNFDIDQTPEPNGFYTSKKFTFNFEGGAGIEKTFNDKLATSLEINYGLFNSEMNGNAFILIPQPLSIQLIVYYRIK